MYVKGCLTINDNTNIHIQCTIGEQVKCSCIVTNIERCNKLTKFIRSPYQIESIFHNRDCIMNLLKNENKWNSCDRLKYWYYTAFKYVSDNKYKFILTRIV